MLRGKKIILGITGSIAAYKAAILVRLLVKEGAEVRVIMTTLAKEFITPLTLATLSKNPILVDFFDPENGQWNSHVDLGLWADAFIIAPATANTISKMSTGIADNLLLTTYLSARCPVFVAPAMDVDMFQHPATQKSIDILKSYGNHVLEPTTGELASGLEGKGRMTEPETIIGCLNSFFQKKNSLSKNFVGKKVLVTAGPTFESIDPVRYIGNHSSGKMGYAIAEEAAELGAEVVLISGPVQINPVHKNIHLIKVTSAAEMFEAAFTAFKSSDISILSAAVADFTPEQAQLEKIKEKQSLNLALKPTVDIAFELGKVKRENQILVGFALETSLEFENAFGKLKKKNFDFIVLNSLRDKGVAFGADSNKITIIDSDNKQTGFELKHKSDVAKDILNKVLELLQK